MNGIIANVYSTVMPSAPYVIAAYAFIWIVLFMYVAIIVRGMKKNEQDIALLEEILQKRSQVDDSGEPVPDTIS